MKKNSDPLETIIDFAWSTGADMFWVNNAKDELKKMRQQIANQAKYEVVAWAQINSGGDLYDLRLQNNPYNDQNKVVPLYRVNNG